MSMNVNDCESEVRQVFEKLTSWREESQIIDSYSSSISKGVGDLVKEVFHVKKEQAAIKKERNVLLETVGNLNGEIKNPNAKLSISKPVPQPGEIIDHVISKQYCSETEISIRIEDNLERQNKVEVLEVNTEFHEEDIANETNQQQCIYNLSEQHRAQLIII